MSSVESVSLGRGNVSCTPLPEFWYDIQYAGGFKSFGGNPVVCDSDERSLQCHELVQIDNDYDWENIPSGRDYRSDYGYTQLDQAWWILGIQCGRAKFSLNSFSG